MMLMYYSTVIFFGSIFVTTFSVSNAAKCDLCPNGKFDKKKKAFLWVECGDVIATEQGAMICDNMAQLAQSSGCCIYDTPGVRGAGNPDGKQKGAKPDKKKDKDEDKDKDDKGKKGDDKDDKNDNQIQTENIQVNNSFQTPTQLPTLTQAPTQTIAPTQAPTQTIAPTQTPSQAPTIFVIDKKEDDDCPRCTDTPFFEDNFLANAGFSGTTCKKWFPLKDFKKISASECEAQQTTVRQFGCCSRDNADNQFQDMAEVGVNYVGNVGGQMIEQTGLTNTVNDVVDKTGDVVNVASTVASTVNTFLCGISFFNNC